MANIFFMDKTYALAVSEPAGTCATGRYTILLMMRIAPLMTKFEASVFVC